MIAKLAESSKSSSATSSLLGSKSFLHLSSTTTSSSSCSSRDAQDVVAQPKATTTTQTTTTSSSKKNESKRKRTKLLDQLLQTNWSKQSQQANNLMKLNKMLLVCDANFLDEKSGESPLSLAISSAQINNASHQMLFTSISAHSQSSTSSSSSLSSSIATATTTTANTTSAGFANLQCQIPVHGLGRLELISLQQASITELIQSKALLIQRILVLLIKTGALIDFRNADGRTPLHMAAMKSNYWALKTLLDLGK